MLNPSKHELLKLNIIVLGADIISILRRKPQNVEDLYQSINRKKELSLEKYFDVLTFLWLGGYIKVNEQQVNLITR